MKTPLSILIVVLCFPVGAICADADKDAVQSMPPVAVKENEEVARMFAEDQADRKPEGGKPFDWKKIGARDNSRLKRVKEIYQSNELRTGKDYYHAAMILQHGDRPEDYLLCHELCVAAVFKSGGSPKAGWLGSAKWLAAASHDRFLLSIGRAQRFGTQFSDSGPKSSWRLDKMEAGVSDELRKAWSVPTLAQAKEREAEMNQKK